MKKIGSLLFAFILFTGCGIFNITNTPTKQVESFFSKYQSLDGVVLEQLEKTAEEEDRFNEEQKEEYIELMKKHYRNLNYDIKDEVEDGDTAVVTVEIEVTDYSKKMDEINTYLINNPKEFESNGEYDSKLFTTYQLNELKKVSDKVKYTLEINLTKVEEEWKMENITEEDELKIHGMYQY